MPTSPLRLFWNRTTSAFSFSGQGGNPLGSDMTHNVSAAEAIADPASFGAIYNIQDITPAQATANFAAIQKAIASLPDSGGALAITGYLQYEGTITNPQRVFTPQVAVRPIPFELYGGPQSALIQLQAGTPAVDLEGGYSFQVGSTSAPVIMCNLQVYSKGKGVVTRNGGKETQLFGLRIAGCADTALDIQYFDGGRIRDVYCLNNLADGVHIDQAHMDDIILTSRYNGGVGMVITNSAAHKSFLYSESNKGLAAKIDGFKQSRCMIWFENNNGNSYNTQSQVTNSPYNAWEGNAQQDANLAWDMDDVSACTSTMNGRPIRDVNAKKVPLAWPPVQGNIHGPNNQPAGCPLPISTVVGQTVQISVPVGYYTQQNGNVTSNWIELYSYGWYPPLQQSFVVGQSVMARVRVKADPTMAAYFKLLMQLKQTAPTLKIALQGATGVLNTSAQAVHLRDTNEFEIEVITTVAKAGSDTIRLFLYLCPVVLGTNPDQLQPADPQLLTITAMDFFVLGGI